MDLHSSQGGMKFATQFHLHLFIILTYCVVYFLALLGQCLSQDFCPKELEGLNPNDLMQKLADKVLQNKIQGKRPQAHFYRRQFKSCQYMSPVS